MLAELVETAPIGDFTYRWPDQEESFRGGWECLAQYGPGRYRVRHGLGGRVVYGSERLHTVTFVGEAPRVEGVAADDYDVSRGLMSVLRIPGARRYVREPHEIPPGYEDFEVVQHSDEIRHQNSPRSLVLKIREDDLARWCTHAILRELTRPEPAQWSR